MNHSLIIHRGRPVWGFLAYIPTAYAWFGGLDRAGLLFGLALIPYFGAVYWAWERVVR